ncbi:ankyrin repeat and SOCS box protein 3-like [Corythoichthys intestinalis]|uniref:ankyrin repeat and SOCS box protein 3-like n=1 Tax=Corythoichthys intestinalis TaxID=161448 RepID=UPI0025A567F1|nr:ankyrin repeat and SOCS box protein 3-like [Corythoichthys intestinalis]
MDLADNRGWRAIHVAAAAGRVGSLTHTLSAAAKTAGSPSRFKAYVNSTTRKGETACYLAAKRGKLSTLRLLVRKGADINQQTKDRSCPLFAAVTDGRKDMVQFLLAKGALVDRVHTASCWTCLHQAVYVNNVDIVRMLVTQTNLEACDNKEITPLILAAQHGHRECVEVLFQAGAALRITEWGFVLTKTDLVELVLDLRWLYPPSFPGNEADKIKSALTPEEFQDMCATALARSDLAQEWLPPLIRAGLDPYLMLHTDILMEAKGSIVNFLLQFVNWSTLTTSSKAILCHRRAEGTWQPFPEFDAIPDLLHLCRLQLRSIMGPDLVLNSGVVQRLPMPTPLHSFLQFKDIQVDNTDFS